MKLKILAGLETVIVSGGTVLDKAWKNIDTPYEPIIVSIKYESSSIVQRMGDMMVFGMSQERRKQLFSSPKRLFPIVFISTDQDEHRVIYNIPEGYEVSVMPKKIALSTPFADYLREYESHGTQINVTEIDGFKPCRIPIDKYPSVQNYLDEIARKTNDKILIKKKG